MEDLIKNIHKSDIFGVFIETGCGLALTQELLSISGASNTVYYTQSPYSKTFFESEYNLKNKNTRSVSPEYLKSILETEKILKLFENNTINTLYASSFQIGEKNDKSTHGWILIKYKGTLKYYHISIHESLTRKEYIHKISENAIKLLESKNEIIPTSCNVDIVLNEDLTFNKKDTLEFISNLESTEQFTVFYKNKIDRLESITRDIEQLIVFKGSFNPVQKAHEYIINRSLENYNTKAVFMISLNVFQKGKQNTDSILKRIELLNELDLPVVICNKPFFKDNINYLRNKFDKKIILSMGLDTFNRLMDDYKENNNYNIVNFRNDFENVEFFCFNRDKYQINEVFLEQKDILNFENTNYMEVSSTIVRELLENKNYAEIKNIVPERAYKLLIEQATSS
ncbi:MAG: hypothetical protein U0457_19835 [Candidatus Sericytochromatia bacterium]